MVYSSATLINYILFGCFGMEIGKVSSFLWMEWPCFKATYSIS